MSLRLTGDVIGAASKKDGRHIMEAASTGIRQACDYFMLEISKGKP